MKVDRIQNRTFEAETRCFFSCNPRAKDRSANQRTMDTFRYICQSIQDIFPQMMIRRVDLVLFATSYDIENKELIYNPEVSSTKAKIATADRLRSLVYYAWNLKPEQIRITHEMSKIIRGQALKLAAKFGGCADLPICYPEDFRKTFCRLVVAFAVLNLASDDEFQTITPNEAHVEYMASFFDNIYSADNCRLDAYSTLYREEHGLENPEKLLETLTSHMEDPARKDRIKFMITQLLHIDPTGNEKINQQYFTNQLEVTRVTINRDLQPFIEEKLIRSSRGYQPTTKLIQFINYVEKNYPDTFKIEAEG